MVSHINAPQIAVDNYSAQIEVGGVDVANIDKAVASAGGRVDGQVCPTKGGHIIELEFLELKMAWRDFAQMCGGLELGVGAVVGRDHHVVTVDINKAQRSRSNARLKNFSRGMKSEGGNRLHEITRRVRQKRCECKQQVSSFFRRSSG